jgi:hypothetical protein
MKTKSIDFKRIKRSNIKYSIQVFNITINYNFITLNFR